MMMVDFLKERDGSETEQERMVFLQYEFDKEWYRQFKLVADPELTIEAIERLKERGWVSEHSYSSRSSARYHLLTDAGREWMQGEGAEEVREYESQQELERQERIERHEELAWEWYEQQAEK